MSSDGKTQLPVGTVIRGKEYIYTIEKVLGQGAFGITYLASITIPGPLGRVTVQVALKEFFAKDLDLRQSDGSILTRTEDGIAYKYAKAFQRESMNLSRMKHPGIVNVLEAFNANGTCYYSMEYLSGGCLHDKVNGNGIPEEEAILLITKIGEALSYMHGRKMMHLDLKPKNIMLKGDGSPVIIDFGLSKQFNSEGEPESSSTIGLGTPGYAPSEQANQSSGGYFQPTLDIYALGATLYKILTGSTPPNGSAILEDGLSEDELKAKGVSANTIAAICKAMQPRRKERPQSVDAFLAELHQGPSDDHTEKSRTEDDGTRIGTPPPKTEPKSRPEAELPSLQTPSKSKFWLWVLPGAVAAVILAIVIFGGKKHNDTPTNTPFDSTATATVTEPGLSLEEATTVTPHQAPAPEKPGSLKVTSSPSGAAIWLDGKYTYKKTPVTFDNLSPGAHLVRLVLEGYQESNNSVTVLSDKRENLSCKMVVMQETPATLAETPSSQENDQTVSPPVETVSQSAPQQTIIAQTSGTTPSRNTGSGNFNAAVGDYNKGAELLDSDKAQALRLFKKALAEFENCSETEAIDMVSQSKTVICQTTISIAKQQINDGQYDTAVETLKSAISLASAYGVKDASKEAKELVPIAYVRKGAALMKAKDFVGAAAAFKGAVSLTPDDGQTQLLYGQALMQAGDNDSAITALEAAAANGKADQANKLLSNLFLKEGMALVKANKSAEAIAALEKANGYVESANAYKLIASANTKLGKSKAVIEAYKKYLEVDPNAKDAADVMFTIAATAQRASDKATAIEYYMKLTSNPKYSAQASAQLEVLR